MDVKITRTRAISTPLTNYELWETEWAYIFNKKVGEKITTVPRKDAIKYFGNMQPVDFWIFDSKYAAFIRYDKSGAFLKLEDATNHISQLEAIRSKLINL